MRPATKEQRLAQERGEGGGKKKEEEIEQLSSDLM